MASQSSINAIACAINSSILPTHAHASNPPMKVQCNHCSKKTRIFLCSDDTSQHNYYKCEFCNKQCWI